MPKPSSCEVLHTAAPFLLPSKTHGVYAVLQMVKPDKEVEKVKGCAAQMDAGALVAMVSHKPVYEGLRASLEDIWLGHKEDPHKVQTNQSLAQAPPLHVLHSLGVWQCR